MPGLRPLQAPLSRRATGGTPKRPKVSASSKVGQGQGRADDAKRYRIKRNPNQPPPAHHHHAPSSSSGRPGAITPQPGSPSDEPGQQHLPWLLPSNASSAISLDLPEMTAENEATDGARFEHLVQPQAHDPPYLPVSPHICSSLPCSLRHATLSHPACNPVASSLQPCGIQPATLRHPACSPKRPQPVPLCAPHSALRTPHSALGRRATASRVPSMSWGWRGLAGAPRPLCRHPK